MLDIRDIRDSSGHPGLVEVTTAVIRDRLGHQGMLEVTTAIIRDSSGHQGMLEVTTAVIRDRLGHPGMLEVIRVITAAMAAALSVAPRMFSTTTRSSTLVLST